MTKRGEGAVRLLAAFARAEGGAATAWALGWTMIILMVGGLALDAANAFRVKAQMQAAAEAAALAGALKLPDMDAARAQAVQVAGLNMPPERHGAVLSNLDVVEGRMAAGGGFEVSAGAGEAIRVTLRRERTRGNPVPTFLLDLVGFNAWDVGVTAVAGQSGETGDSCADLMILSETDVRFGGGGVLSDGVCVHGETGVRFGGGSFFDPGVRISAADADDIRIGHVKKGSAGAEDLVVEESRAATIVPGIDARFATLWDELWGGAFGTYSGPLLPDYLHNAAGYAFVERVHGWWNIKKGELQPNTIYVVDGGVGFNGTVDAEKVAVIARGQINIGGGKKLNFKDVYFFADGRLGGGGAVTWGDPDRYCEAGRYNVYLLSTDTLQLGGSAQIYGVVGAAPTFNPGGNMTAVGAAYFEASNTIQMGGSVEAAGCEGPLESFHKLSRPRGAARSRLLR